MPATDPSGDALLVLAAGADPARLHALRARVLAGEPAPYVAGFLSFRHRRFHIDPRAFITDPETSLLVDAVLSAGDHLESKLHRPPRVLEFGTGAGTLAISLKLDRPHWPVSGLDIDPSALALARENALTHHTSIEFLISDYFSAWPAHLPPPDIIFGDPPWGGTEDLYDDGRDADYYRQMPAASAFPPGGGRCTIHDEIIKHLVALRWPSLLILNYGVLPREIVERSTAPLASRSFATPEPHLTIMSGHARARLPKL